VTSTMQRSSQAISESRPALMRNFPGSSPTSRSHARPWARSLIFCLVRHMKLARISAPSVLGFCFMIGLAACSTTPQQRPNSSATESHVRSSTIVVLPGRPLTMREPMTRLSDFSLRVHASAPVHLIVSSGSHRYFDHTIPSVDLVFPAERVGQYFDLQWTNDSADAITVLYEIRN
jgi:hypothetical protein